MYTQGLLPPGSTRLVIRPRSLGAIYRRHGIPGSGLCHLWAARRDELARSSVGDSCIFLRYSTPSDTQKPDFHRE